MLEERDRFLKLFDIQVKNANAWLERMPEDKYDWVPIDNPNVQLGDRVPKLTIRAFHVHMTVTDHHWFRSVRDCPDGATIEIPLDTELTEKLATSDFTSMCLSMHAENVRIVSAFSEDTLRKNFTYADVQRTGMEFLWNNYAHRAHHLGHMDMYLRQANVEAPLYYPF